MYFYPYFHVLAEPAAARPLTARQVARAYGFPTDVDGTGQHVAIIELGGGFKQSDLDKYFASLGLPTPRVNVISVQGADNSPGSDADAEVLLDIMVAGAVAPGVVFDVYFCPNTDAGFLAGVTAAIDSHPASISISWGAPETAWTHDTMLAFDAEFARAASLGIPVFVAAGDAGADDGTNAPVADFPASSPNVIGCGGTELTLTSTGDRANEVVWNEGVSSAGGGGFSRVFPRPDWQPTSVGAYRGVPDFSGCADPRTGYKVIINGAVATVGGTSAVAPLLAAWAALLAHKGFTGLAKLARDAYGNKGLVYDVTAGNNRGYSAGADWDAASGVGVPIGPAYVAFLAAQPSPTPEPPTPTPEPPAPTPRPVDGADLALAAAMESWLHTRGLGLVDSSGKVRLDVFPRS